MKIGILIRKANAKPYSGANKYYHFGIVVVSDKPVQVAFTDFDIARSRRRASRNPEDFEKKKSN